MARIAVRCRPGAKHETVAVTAEGALSASVAAPPTDGRANDRLVMLLSKKLRVPKSACRIVRGRTSRNKLVDIDTLGRGEILARLTEQNPASAAGGAGAGPS